MSESKNPCFICKSLKHPIRHFQLHDEPFAVCSKCLDHVMGAVWEVLAAVIADKEEKSCS